MVTSLHTASNLRMDNSSSTASRRMDSSLRMDSLLMDSSLSMANNHHMLSNHRMPPSSSPMASHSTVLHHHHKALHLLSQPDGLSIGTRHASVHTTSSRPLDVLSGKPQPRVSEGLTLVATVALTMLEVQRVQLELLGHPGRLGLEGTVHLRTTTPNMRRRNRRRVPTREPCWQLVLVVLP